MNIGAPVDYPAVLGGLLVLNWPVYRQLWRLLFRSNAEGKEAFWWFFVRADLVSFFRGQLWQDLSKSSKAALLFLTCLVIVSVEYAAIESLIKLIVQEEG